MEEGCYVLAGEHVDVLGEVSPDGSLRKVHLEENGTPVVDVYVVIEIKCPFPSDRQLPVHYTLPAYYVCQCLAKMVVLHTDLLIFRIPETVRPSTKYISVRLWESIWKDAVELYDVKDPVKLKSTRPVKNDKRRNSQIR